MVEIKLGLRAQTVDETGHRRDYYLVLDGVKENEQVVVQSGFLLIANARSRGCRACSIPPVSLRACLVTQVIVGSRPIPAIPNDLLRQHRRCPLATNTDRTESKNHDEFYNPMVFEQSVSGDSDLICNSRSWLLLADACDDRDPDIR